MKGILFLKEKKYEEAAAYFRRLVGLQPREQIWYYYLTESLVGAGKLDDAQKMAIKMETIMRQKSMWDPHIVSIYLQGKIAYHADDYTSALRAFEKIKKHYRRNSEFCFYYGATLMKMNETKKAKRFVKRAIRRGYDDVDPAVKQSLGI